MQTSSGMQASAAGLPTGQYELEILLDNQPAALERVLQVVRYRQFNVEALHMQPDGQDKLTVNMKVSSQHSISILTTQLNKLYDLARLSIQHEMPLKATA